MRIRLAIPDHLVTPAALEATTLANAESIRRGEVPTLSSALSRGLKWRPEPFIDGEHFDLAHQVVGRGWGDCDDLAPWLAAELRATGQDEGARPRIYSTGKDRFHAVVETSDGEILDPSRWAGMGKRSAPSSRGVVGQLARPFAHDDAGGLCVLPSPDGQWMARADLPWPDATGHLASHAKGRTPDQALNRAIAGAMVCGEAIESPLCDRLREAGRLVLGSAEHMPSAGDMSRARGYLKQQHPELELTDAQVAEWWGKLTPDTRTAVRRYRFDKPDTMGDAVKSAAKKAVSMAAPMAANMLLPGSGSLLSSLTQGSARGGRTPGALTDRSGGQSLLLPGAGSAERPMTLYYHPAGAIGPVVVRF